MKKILLVLSCLVLSCLVLSCASTGKLEKIDNKTVVYNCSIEKIPEMCEKQKVFTTIQFSKCYRDPNWCIGKIIQRNFDRPKEIKNLPNDFKKAKTIFCFNQDDNTVDFFTITKESIVLRYSFRLEIDENVLNYFSKLTYNYTEYLYYAEYFKNKAEDSANPLIEKTRYVPYTAYKSETLFGETRLVSYTDYRWETRTVPNPNYNPTASIEYQLKSSSYSDKAEQTKLEIDNLSFFKIFYN